MFLSDKEVDAIRKRLANIERAEKMGIKKNYLTNQVRQVRLMLIRAERREKNTLL